MNPSTILLMLLYSGALVFVIYFIVQRYRPTPIIIQQAPTVINYPESVWWPWSTGSYNSWPYWTGWWSGGGNGGYSYRGGYRDRVGHMGRMDGRMSRMDGGGGGRMGGVGGRMGGVGGRMGGGDRMGGGGGRMGGGGGGGGRGR